MSIFKLHGELIKQRRVTQQSRLEFDDKVKKLSGSASESLSSGKSLAGFFSAGLVTGLLLNRKAGTLNSRTELASKPAKLSKSDTRNSAHLDFDKSVAARATEELVSAGTSVAITAIGEKLRHAALKA